MNKKYNVAVVGATGAVGETMLEILAERQFPINKLYAVASERSAGDALLYANKPLMVDFLISQNADVELSSNNVRNSYSLNINCYCNK